jgi:SAM-dependent methyltransferase
MRAFGRSFDNAEDGLYVSSSGTKCCYSDGHEKESQLFQVINSAQDLSSLSLELHKRQQSWVERYHLSMHRGAIIRCLPLSSNSRVLEIGSGCGAITRSLGEKFISVDAIEGSLSRARICASRCRDLPNVRVFISDINEIETEPNYDLVVLVGVLEWSKGFIGDTNPFQKCLRIASKALKEDGRILIAIENRLGLKYFLGSGEDHCGTPLEGLHGYPTFDSAETFSKLRLSSILLESGFNAVRFLYPFPDYKAARVVLTDEAVSLNSESIGYWVSRYPFEDYLHSERRLVGNQALISCEVVKAGLLSELSNSFLVLASRQLSALPDQPWVVWSERLTRNSRLRCMTMLEKASPVLQVRKIYPHISSAEQASFPGGFGLNVQPSQPFFLEGSILELELLRHAIGGRSDRFFHVVQEWMDYVETNFLFSDKYIAPKAWDCIPRNLVRLNDGTLKAFDLEFSSPGPIPIEELCARGLLWWYVDNAAWAASLNPDAKNIGDHLRYSLTTLFANVDADSLIAATLERENSFQALLSLSTNSKDVSELLNIPVQDIRDSEQQVVNLTRQLQNSQAQLNRLRHHIVIGKVLSMWRTLFNPDLP